MVDPLQLRHVCDHGDHPLPALPEYPPALGLVHGLEGLLDVVQPVLGVGRVDILGLLRRAPTLLAFVSAPIVDQGNGFEDVLWKRGHRQG